SEPLPSRSCISNDLIEPALRATTICPEASRFGTCRSSCPPPSMMRPLTLIFLNPRFVRFRSIPASPLLEVGASAVRVGARANDVDRQHAAICVVDDDPVFGERLARRGVVAHHQLLPDASGFFLGHRQLAAPGKEFRLGVERIPFADAPFFDLSLRELVLLLVVPALGDAARSPRGRRERLRRRGLYLIETEGAQAERRVHFFPRWPPGWRSAHPSIGDADGADAAALQSGQASYAFCTAHGTKPVAFVCFSENGR